MLVYRTACNLSPSTLDGFTRTLDRYRSRKRIVRRVIDTALQALLTLVYLEGGGTYAQLAHANDVDDSTLWRHIQEGIKVLARRAVPLVEVVRLAKRAGWDYLIVDGVNIPTERVMAKSPANRRYFSGKHKRHSMNVQTVCAPDGTLLWVSGALPGKTVDITAARHFKIIEKLGDDLAALCDRGYVGLPGAIVGYRRARGQHRLPIGKRAVNYLIAVQRCIGERGNAQLKNHKILAQDMRCAPKRITAIVKAVQAVHYLEVNPFGFLNAVTES